MPRNRKKVGAAFTPENSTHHHLTILKKQEMPNKKRMPEVIRPNYPEWGRLRADYESENVPLKLLALILSVGSFWFFYSLYEMTQIYHTN